MCQWQSSKTKACVYRIISIMLSFPCFWYDINAYGILITRGYWSFTLLLCMSIDICILLSIMPGLRCHFESVWQVYKILIARLLWSEKNKAYRKLIVMFHLPRHTRVSNIFVKQKIPSFPVLRRKLVYSMYKRVLTSSNSLVQALVDSNFFVSSKIFKKWMEIFFNSWQY